MAPFTKTESLRRDQAQKELDEIGHGNFGYKESMKRPLEDAS